MKKSSLLVALSLMFCLTLSSCTNQPAPVEPEVVYNAEKVATDFNAIVVEEGYGEYISPATFDEYDEYSTFAIIDESEDESEESLGTAAATLASFLPEYMELSESVYGDPADSEYIDIFKDGSYYYYMEFLSPKEVAYAVVISYVYSGYLVAQIGIGDIVE